MLWKLLLTLLISCNTYANTTSIGVEKVDKHLSFTSAHNIIFDHKPWYRYGLGHSRLRVGTKTGVIIRSNGGFPVLWTGDYLTSKQGFFIASDTGNAHVNLTHGDERDFYNLMPGGAAGLYSRRGNFSLDISAKTGFAITNFYSHKLLSPDVYKYHGYQAVAFIYPKLGFSYDKYFMRDNESSAYSLHYKINGSEQIIYRQEENNYDRIEKRSMLMFNLEF